MKCSKSVIAATLSMVLAACGSSSSKKDEPVVEVPQIPEIPALALVAPQEGDVMVEDFPIALYVTYPDGEQSVDSITSFDVNWPHFNIHQSGKELGYIDALSDELFYRSVSHDSSDALSAIDLEQQQQTLWYVSGDNSIYRYDIESNETASWPLAQQTQLTELAIDEEDANNLWLFDEANHHLIHFNVASEQTDTFALEGDFNLTGLSIAEDNLLMLANDGTAHIVMHYQVEGTTLTHVKSWQLAGFADAAFNDIGMLPDGRVAVSTSGQEQNLYLVVDRAEMLGDGPIEDDGRLERVGMFALDDTIAQPSGIWSLDDGSWMLITDQAEMFALDNEFNITEKFDIAFDSVNCNQGCTEAIVGGVDRFYALADGGLVGLFDKSDSGYHLTQEFRINEVDENGEAYTYSGLAYDQVADEFYVVTEQGGDEQQDKLIVLDSDFTTKAVHDIFYAGESEGSIFEYDAQGVAYYDGSLYVLSEKFTKVLQLNLTGEITAVFDLSDEDVEVPSDLAIRDGKFYIIGDHENDQPVPPVSMFMIEDE